jgi:hypothetical protein
MTNASSKLSEGPVLPEYMSRDNNNPYKLILMCLQSLMPGKYQTDFSYLFVKILNLSAIYKELLDEKKWVKKMISKLLGSRLKNGRFWLFFTPLKKQDFEIEIMRVFNLVDLDKDFLVAIANQSENNS